MTPLQQAKSVAREPYAWPGGYPRFLVTTDGGVLCPTCVRKQFRCIAYSAITKQHDGWAPAAADINWEDSFLICDHCNERIPSAYAEDPS